MAKMRKSGFFIVFEGGEASGKSTQIALLSKRLKKERFSVVVSREPGGTEMGKQIRKILLDPKWKTVSPLAELLLYQADRAQHVYEIVYPALEAGQVVISDRFADSSTVYQGMCRGLGKAGVEKLNGLATGGLEPDLVILLDLAESVGRQRLKKRGKLDRLEKEKMAFHSAVRKAFLKLAREKGFAVIDAAGDISEIHEAIYARVIRELQKRM